MIYRAKITGGYAAKLPAFAEERVFSFTPGVNILIGPNGSGSSTLLYALACHLGINPDKSAGWSRFWEPIELKDYSHGIDTIKLPASFKHKTPDKQVSVELEEDGSPAFYFDTERLEVRLGKEYWQVEATTPDGTKDEGLKALKPSRGMLVSQCLMALEESLTHVPDLTTKESVPKNFGYGIDAEKVAALQMAYWTRQRGGPITLLIDKPESYLSLRNQIGFFASMLPRLGRTYQVIVATHSPLAMLHAAVLSGEWNMIDLTEGYAADTQLALADYLNAQADATQKSDERTAEQNAGQLGLALI